MLVVDGRSSDPPGPSIARALEALAAAVSNLRGDAEGPSGASATAPLPPFPPGRRSPAMQRARDLLSRASSTRLPVLLVGETGSGKEGLARWLHEAGPRSSHPFVAVNCAAIPETLLESELFGAVRGAYTGADRDRPGLFRTAHRGTLFLDEVGDMATAMQAKLLRVLQDGGVRALGAAHAAATDVRVVAATHRDLEAGVREGWFREDLYWRLAILPVRVPSLRERPEDLPEIAVAVLETLRRSGLEARGISVEALAELERHTWPGNVRELEAVLARAALRAGRGTILAAHLEPLGRDGPIDVGGPPGLEHDMIRRALEATGGRLTEAARRIGWTRQKLHRRMVALGLRSGRSSLDQGS